MFFFWGGGMLIMDLLIPLTMIFFGKMFIRKPPKEVNMFFGYRTSMSMKNKDTWDFAHKYYGKIWYYCGLVTLPLTALAMLMVLGKSEDCIGRAGGMICMIQMIPLVGGILPTELALRKQFDRDGVRREKGKTKEYNLSES